MTSGGLCVMTVGTPLMLLWSVSSWDMLTLEVSTESVHRNYVCDSHGVASFPGLLHLRFDHLHYARMINSWRYTRLLQGPITSLEGASNYDNNTGLTAPVLDHVW